jgi:hypothetical protein
MSAKSGSAAGALSAAGIVAPSGMHLTEIALAVLVALLVWLVASTRREQPPPWS